MIIGSRPHIKCPLDQRPPLHPECRQSFWLQSYTIGPRGRPLPRLLTSAMPPPAPSGSQGRQRLFLADLKTSRTSLQGVSLQPALWYALREITQALLSPASFSDHQKTDRRGLEWPRTPRILHRSLRVGLVTEPSGPTKGLLKAAFLSRSADFNLIESNLDLNYFSDAKEPLLATKIFKFISLCILFVLFTLAPKYLKSVTPC